MEPITPFLIAILGLGVCLSVDRETKKRKVKQYTSLTHDECYVLSCLLKVSPRTIYGATIRHTLDQDLQDASKLRTLLCQLQQSMMENPGSMYTILGEEAFFAVAEHGIKTAKA